MARFGAAAMSGAEDKRFQDRYNYLLELLDSGYFATKMIGNKELQVEVSPVTGLLITLGGEPVLSISNDGQPLVNNRPIVFFKDYEVW